MIDYTNTSNQYIEYTSFSNVQNLVNRTILVWMNLDSLVVSRGVYGLGNSAVIDANEFWELGASSTANKLFFGVGWSTTDGLWRTTNDLVTGLSHIAVTYNNSSTTNDPIVYINGAAQALTEVATPAGTYRNGTTGTIRIGSARTVTSSIDGKISSALIYNRILSAAEILDAYNSRLAIPSYNGLVFAPDLRGAAGGVGDGSALAAGNVVRDYINGASGVPAGSPVLRADTYLNYK